MKLKLNENYFKKSKHPFFLNLNISKRKNFN